MSNKKARQANVPVIQNHLCLDIFMAFMFVRQSRGGLVYSNRARLKKNGPDPARPNPFIIARILIYLAVGTQCLINF